MTSQFEPVPGLFQANFCPAEFAERRQRVLAQIGDGVALVQGAGAAGGVSLFRQTNEFYYLCGVEVPHSYLLLGRRDRSDRRSTCPTATPWKYTTGRDWQQRTPRRRWR